MNSKYTMIMVAMLTASLFSCGIKTILLENKITEVPVDSKAYINRDKFNNSLLKQVDTSAVYQEAIDNRGWSGVYRFYPNGCLNWFYIEGGVIPSADYFNPHLNGYRGVYYIEKGTLKADLFAEVSELRAIGRLTKVLKIQGDTLFVKHDDGVVDRYTKKRLPRDYFIYKADW